MDSDREAGAAKHLKGSVKEAIGKLTGNTTTEADGAAEKAQGQVEDAAGKAKNAPEA